jgi:hypothetical protein
MARELILYCDESLDRGRHFSNFYGGALVESQHLLEVESRLQSKKTTLHFHSEVKWQKITENYASKYIALIDEVFALMGEGKLKMRIMFTHNYMEPTRLTPHQRENQFLLLYYQFLKHTFGLPHAGASNQKTGIRIYLDKLPATREQISAFKGYLFALNQNARWRAAKIAILEAQLAEVDSNDHVIMQALDIVLGSIQFRLNNMHLEKPKGEHRRGKRTIAKEKVYKHINKRIREVTRRAFNIGISTGWDEEDSLWRDPYRHWRFVSTDAEIKPEFSKKKLKQK